MHSMMMKSSPGIGTNMFDYKKSIGNGKHLQLHLKKYLKPTKATKTQPDS